MASRLEALTHQYKAEKDRQKRDMLRFQIQGEVTRVLAATMDRYSDCLDQIVDTVAAIMGAARVSLMVRKRSFLDMSSSVGIPREVLEKRTLVRIGQGIAGKVAETGEPVITGDLTRDEDLAQDAQGGDQYKSNAFICLPLKFENEVVGVINVSNPVEGKSFKMADFNFLKKTADLIGVMLHKSMQFETLRQKTAAQGRVSLPGGPAAVVPRTTDAAQAQAEGDQSVDDQIDIMEEEKPRRLYVKPITLKEKPKVLVPSGRPKPPPLPPVPKKSGS